MGAQEDKPQRRATKSGRTTTAPHVAFAGRLWATTESSPCRHHGEDRVHCKARQEFYATCSFHWKAQGDLKAKPSTNMTGTRKSTVKGRLEVNCSCSLHRSAWGDHRIDPFTDDRVHP